ncbi:hypothetical protein H0H81_003165 [Sphagnurus paluster]|uniref:Uncharacterized protein n=1 Tax=Sphagnurus paluster TaxID=117069 RepID=A0A9P7KK97_9AGAR|nr:hypothetical protein H0H81_003165 [Sphagnurus paluster]
MADQSGRTIIITGGNSGVGKACAKALLQRNANVYLACRSQSSAQSTIFELEELTGKKAKFIHLDLSNLGSVKTAVEEFLRNENQLHVLFNNAGIMFTPMEDEINGYDSQIHTNVLEESFKPRVVNVSSSGHYVAGSVPLDFNTFKSGPMRRRRITEEICSQVLVKFLIPWARIGLPRHETEDPQLGKDLWDWLEEQIED